MCRTVKRGHSGVIVQTQYGCTPQPLGPQLRPASQKIASVLRAFAWHLKEGAPLGTNSNPFRTQAPARSGPAAPTLVTMMDGGAALPVPDGDGTSEHDRELTSHGSASDVGGSFSRDMMSIMRVLAETQRDLARSRGGDKANKVRVLSNIKIPEFEGGVSTSVRRYREWRKKLDITQDLSALTNSEMAMLLYEHFSLIW